MVQARWNNAILADSEKTIVIEGNHYFPPDAINRDYLEATDHTTPLEGDRALLHRLRERRGQPERRMDLSRSEAGSRTHPRLWGVLEGREGRLRRRQLEGNKDQSCNGRPFHVV